MTLWSQALAHFRWQDGADIGFLTLVLALVYRWLRGTIAIQVALAISIVLVGAWLARQLGLVLTSAALSALGAIAAVAIVVIFKDEIRRGLSHVNLFGWWRGRIARRDGSNSEEPIAEAVFTLAPRRIGALIVVPRHDDISDQLTGGSNIDGLLTASLLEAIFTSDSPLHDGAAIVRAGRVVRAGVVLPLSSADLPESFGTRHRAALGLSEISDAVVVCVSEERGEVSVAADGVITEVTDAIRLVATLASLGQGSEKKQRTRRRTTGDAERARLRHDGLLADAFAYLAILVGVGGAWSARAFDRSQSVARPVSLEFRGLNDNIGFEPPEDNAVVVELRGPRRQLEVLPPGRVTAFIDLAHATPGRHSLPVSASVPDGIKVVSVIPASIEVDVLERRAVPVALTGADHLPPGLRIIALVPSSVQLVGGSAAFHGVRSVKAGPLDQVARSGNIELALTVPKGLRLVDSKQGHVLAVVGYEPNPATTQGLPHGR
jgi:diadenylate cyclase